MTRSFFGLRRRKAADVMPLSWTWLSNELLLACAPAETAAGDWSVHAARPAQAGGGPPETGDAGAKISRVRFEIPEQPAVDVLVVRLAGGDPQDGELASLILTSPGGRATRVDRDGPAGGALELNALMARAQLARGDLRSREALQQMLLAAAIPELERPGGFSLSGRLQRLRDVLRQPLDPRVIDRSTPLTINVEALMAVDDRSFWIAGWMRDQDRTATSLRLISPEGQRSELLQGAYRHSRPDVEALYAGTGLPAGERYGFVKYAELPAPSLLDDGWLVELRTGTGRGIELPAPPVVRDPTEVLNRILSEFELERTGSDRLRAEQAHPALQRFQRSAAAAVELDEVESYGAVPEDPEVSVVVPLYERIDFLEHQLAQFGRDPELARAELVYVLDSPELAAQLSSIAPHLQALHRVPFKVVRPSRNAGYAVANNLGVAHTRGRLLVLLNSDVLPTRTGWLGKLASFYDSTPGIGALGPKLLFEDDSIQHAGMYFERRIDSHVWGNKHYFKGFHRDFSDARISRPVPAVTAACLMVARDLYDAVDGLDPDYVRGGYEDSDRCIRLAQEGRTNWYLADVELYHLEAQSYPSPVRRLATVYNAWLQTHRWGEAIEELARAHESFPGSPALTPVD